MSALVWSPRYVVGWPELDDDHRHWFSRVNAFHDAMRAGKSAQLCAGLLRSVIEIMEPHFAREEAEFSRLGYPGAAHHVALHDAFAANVRSRAAALVRGEAIHFDLAAAVTAWVGEHILDADIPFADWAAAPDRH